MLKILSSKIEYIHKKLQFLEDADKKFSKLAEEVDKNLNNLQEREQAVNALINEKKKGFPWLASAFSDYYYLESLKVVDELKSKKHPAISSAEKVKEEAQKRRLAEKQLKTAKYLMEYYESIAPFLVDLREDLDIEDEESQTIYKEYSEEEQQDEVTKYISKEDYRKLPPVERNQRALDLFWRRPKSKWFIGRLYERYVGYLYETQGYAVEYHGIFKGFEDLGRDLICSKGNDLIVIQCKNWSQFRTIYEKHIFQFFGTVFQFKDENHGKNIKGVFYTSTQLSDLARRFAKELGIDLKENVKMDADYPCIKCNVSMVDGSKIYHLPFDQQYDKTKIINSKGEMYCKTVAEAEKAGFRRAFRWHGDKVVV